MVIVHIHTDVVSIAQMRGYEIVMLIVMQMTVEMDETILIISAPVQKGVVAKYKSFVPVYA